MSGGTEPPRSRRWMAVGTVGLALMIADHRGWLLKHGPDDMTAYHGAVVRVSRVIDGGTIEITLPDRMHDQPFTVVRLWGIDCPRPAGRERYAQELAGAARDLTRALTAGRTVLLTLETHRTRGPLGRVLAHVRLVGGTSLNERILAEGLARTDERWPHARLTRYAQVQRAARRRGMGLWKKARRHGGTKGRRFPCSARLSLPPRSDPPDESGGSYESDDTVRSAAADEAAVAYESECEPGGPYGAE